MPVGATGVALNVTVVEPTAAGFVSIRPGDATGSPATSSLNFDAGVVQPNAVTVELPTSGANAGMIDITYDAYGTVGPTTELLIDVVGYTTNAGIQALVAELALKANSADVYTRAQIDGALGNVPVVGPIGAAVPDPFPTEEGGLSLSASFTTDRTSRLQILIHGGLGLNCDAAVTRYVWLELDGAPIKSSLIRHGVGGNAYDAVTLAGITDELVPAGDHTVVVQQACSFGSALGATSIVGTRGLFTYIADDGSEIAAVLPGTPGGGELAAQSAGCPDDAIEVEPGACVLGP